MPNITNSGIENELHIMRNSLSCVLKHPPFAPTQESFRRYEFKGLKTIYTGVTLILLYFVVIFLKINPFIVVSNQLLRT